MNGLMPPPESVENDVADAIFRLLRQKGPLCVSQLSVELLVSPREVENALTTLERRGIVEPRPDSSGREFDKAVAAWGLATSIRRSKR